MKLIDRSQTRIEILLELALRQLETTDALLRLVRTQYDRDSFYPLDEVAKHFATEKTNQSKMKQAIKDLIKAKKLELGEDYLNLPAQGQYLVRINAIKREFSKPRIASRIRISEIQENQNDPTLGELVEPVVQDETIQDLIAKIKRVQTSINLPSPSYGTKPRNPGNSVDADSDNN